MRGPCGERKGTFSLTAAGKTGVRERWRLFPFTAAGKSGVREQKGAFPLTAGLRDSTLAGGWGFSGEMCIFGWRTRNCEELREIERN